MVRFDAHEEGTPAATWQRNEHLSNLVELNLDDIDRLVVVAAHPDDETLGCGGLIARMHASGARVDIVVITDGAASHPRSPTVDHNAMRVMRADELTAAAMRLGDSVTVTHLDFPDGRVVERRDEICNRLRSMDVFGAANTLVLAPWIGDGHPDHEATGEVVARVMKEVGQLFFYPVWMWHWASPSDDRVPWDRAVRIQLDADSRRRKAAAIAEYRSQISPLSDAVGDEAVMDQRVLAHYFDTREIFFRASADPELIGPA